MTLAQKRRKNNNHRHYAELSEQKLNSLYELAKRQMMQFNTDKRNAINLNAIQVPK